MRINLFATTSVDQSYHRYPEEDMNDWTKCHSRLFNRCVSIQGLHPSRDTAFAVFKGESFRETLLTTSTVVKWEGLAFGAFSGCVTRCFTLTSQCLSPRPAKVMTYPTWCHHFCSFILLFSGTQKNLVICEATKDSSGASSKKRETKAAFEGAFKLGRPSHGLQIWPSKDADPELRRRK